MSKTVTTEFPSVRIGGKSYTLTPTLAAVRKLAAAAGGVRAAYRRFSDMDIDVTAATIAAGANIDFRDQKEADVFAEKVWRTPQEHYLAGVSDFFVLLFNGGQRREPVEDEKPAAGGDEGNG